MNIVLGVVDALLEILGWIIIAQVALSWLFVFNVLNPSSQGVRALTLAIDRLTAPLYRPIRRLLPDFGGVDFSPMVLLLVIWIARAKVIGPLIDQYRYG